MRLATRSAAAAAAGLIAAVLLVACCPGSARAPEETASAGPTAAVASATPEPPSPHGCRPPPADPTWRPRPWHLALGRAFDAPPSAPVSYLRAAGDRFVGFAWQDLVVYSPEQARPAALFPNQPVWPDYSEQVRLEYAHRSLAGSWLPFVAGELVRIGQLDGKRHWQSAIYPTVAADPRTAGTSAFIGEVARSGDVLLATFSTFMKGAEPHELVALDWGSGAIRWRLPQKEPLLGIAASSGRAYVLSGDAHLRAYDLGSGALLWTAELAPFVFDAFDLPALREAPGALVVVRPTGIAVVDDDTGAIAREIPLAPPARIDTVSSEPVVDGCTLYAETIRPPSAGATPSVQASVLVAFDLAAGSQRWQAPEVLVDDGGDLPPSAIAAPHAPLFVDADGVYTCLQDAALRVYDRIDGGPVYETGLAFGCEMVPLPPDGAGARRVVVRTRDATPRLLERAAAPEPSERAHVVGRVRLPDGSPFADAPVLVGGALARTNARGDFDVTVAARRVIVVRVPTGAERYAGSGAQVALDGRAGVYSLALDMAPPPPLD